MMLKTLIRHGLKVFLVAGCVFIWWYFRDSSTVPASEGSAQKVPDRTSTAPDVSVTAESLLDWNQECPAVNTTMDVCTPEEAQKCIAEAVAEEEKESADAAERRRRAEFNRLHSLWFHVGPIDMPGFLESDYPMYNWTVDFFPEGLRRYNRSEKRALFYTARYYTAPEDRVCTDDEREDPYDYSADWNWGHVRYLFESNKTRIRCSPRKHNGTTTLEVIKGHLLKKHLAEAQSAGECTMVYFFSSSCPHSYQAAPFMHAAAVYFPTLHFLAVDTDENSGQATWYGILAVPGLAMFEGSRYLNAIILRHKPYKQSVWLFVMSYTDAKYIPGKLNVTGYETGIMTHFRLKKRISILDKLAGAIVFTLFAIMLWKRYLWKVYGEIVARWARKLDLLVHSSLARC